tara:strand:+ start:530 stop:673 length:144 start_codon:yes stop_codon:yes gene_type:complete
MGYFKLNERSAEGPESKPFSSTKGSQDEKSRLPEKPLVSSSGLHIST